MKKFLNKYFVKISHNGFRNKTYLSNNGKFILKIYKDFYTAKNEIYHLRKINKFSKIAPLLIDYSFGMQKFSGEVNEFLSPYTIQENISGETLEYFKSKKHKNISILLEKVIYEISQIHYEFPYEKSNVFLDNIIKKNNNLINILSNQKIINLSQDIFDFNKRIKPLTKNFPTMLCLIHGDLRDKHIFITKKYQEVKIIDWENTQKGDYLIDLAFILKDNFQYHDIIIQFFKEKYKDFTKEKSRLLIFYLSFLCIRDIFQDFCHINRLKYGIDAIYADVSTDVIMEDIRLHEKIIKKLLKLYI